MKALLQRIGVLLFTVALSATTAAGDQAHSVIEKLVAAYGGQALTSMKSLIVRDRYKVIIENGGREPGLDAISRLHSTLTIDFKRGRKSVKNWRVETRGRRLDQIMFDGKQGWSINHLRGSHVVRQNLHHDNVGAGMMRLLDTTLVRLLLDARASAVYQGRVSHLGRDHDQLRFKINGSAEATLYVDSATGLISQMADANGVNYVFSEYRNTGGVTYASDTNQFRAGKLAMTTFSRTLDINPNVANAFDLPANSTALAGMQDADKMRVKSLAEAVYLVGSGAGSSLVVDAGDYFVGVGSLPGFEARLQAVNGKLGTEASVKYLIVPEHQGHMGGINAIADLGANFVTVESHLPALKKQFLQALPDSRFILVDKKLALADGKVQVYDIQTLNSEQFLLFYVPSAKLVYTMDEFGTNLLNSVPSADKRTLSLRQAIEALDIDVQQFAYVHGTGVLSIEQFHQVTDGYKEGRCPKRHTICVY